MRWAHSILAVVYIFLVWLFASRGETAVATLCAFAACCWTLSATLGFVNASLRKLQ